MARPCRCSWPIAVPYAGIYHQMQSIMCWYSRVQACYMAKQEISVDDVRCHQWLTNQIAEAPLHWRHEPTSICKVSVADTSCGKPPVYSCRLPRGSILEQNRPYQCLVQVYFGADTERTAIPSVENSSLNSRVQSCIAHPVGSSHSNSAYCQGRRASLLLQLVHHL